MSGPGGPGPGYGAHLARRHQLSAQLMSGRRETTAVILHIHCVETELMTKRIVAISPAFVFGTRVSLLRSRTLGLGLMLGALPPGPKSPLLLWPG